MCSVDLNKILNLLDLFKVYVFKECYAGSDIINLMENSQVYNSWWKDVISDIMTTLKNVHMI